MKAGASFRAANPGSPSPTHALTRTGHSRARQRAAGRAAFTLVELLTVIAIVSILGSMLLPALTAGKEKARRVACRAHLQQLAAASLMYADDDALRSLSGRAGADDDSLNYLTPYVSGNLSVFTCPSTRNRVGPEQGFNPVTGERGLVDLFRPGAGRLGAQGMSYMANAFIGHGTPYSQEIPFAGKTRHLPYLRKDENNVQTYVKWNDAFGLKGVTPGPSRHWLVEDNYWGGDIRGYPDPYDNHGRKGLNVSFCDGHVEWLPTGEFLKSYEMDTDEGRTGIPLPY